ncbi:MAG: rhodanese-like domain-containing protein [Acidimicrobiia bacterium]|nr:rhodanese-like domain-containing protein [Acidimicrobiia bacterium]
MKRAADLVGEARKRIEQLTPSQVKAEIEASTATIVDIRDIRELYREGKIPGAVHAPRGMLEFWVDPTSEYHRAVFRPEQRYIFYCTHGMRSALATQAVQSMGYEDVAHLTNGFNSWRGSGFDVEPVEKR